MTLLITLTLMRGHMSAQMMMAQNATAGDLMTDPPFHTNTLFSFAVIGSQVKNAARNDNDIPCLLMATFGEDM